MTELWRQRTNQVGWVLLPLRAFLAVVFSYGGISKIADNRFLDASSPLSMHASLVAVRDLSPIGGLLGPVEAHSFAFGVLMAAGEMAVGMGILLGLFTRLAAVGGIAITLSLWLTVSWGATPWYTSADLVYVFAFTPLAGRRRGRRPVRRRLAGTTRRGPAGGGRGSHPAHSPGRRGRGSRRNDPGRIGLVSQRQEEVCGRR